MQTYTFFLFYAIFAPKSVKKVSNKDGNTLLNSK